jgi:hypothetical protein
MTTSGRCTTAKITASVGIRTDTTRKILPTLQLLCVNKQINQEASPIYYGQPFRFTNQGGWVTLYHWLHQIGKDNAALVRNITIFHPVWIDWPKWKYDAQCSDFCMFRDYGMKKRAEFGGGLFDIDAPTGLDLDVQRMLYWTPQLRRLQLIFHIAGELSMWKNNVSEFPIVASVAQVCLKAKIEAINLASYRKEFREIMGYEMTCKEIVDFSPGTFSGPTQTVYSCRRMTFRDPPVLFADVEAAKETLKQLATQNNPIRDVQYDQHRYYPVRAGEECVSNSLCDYLRKGSFCYQGQDEPDYCCPGTKGEIECWGIPT